jgi:hypothetical protein
VHSIGVNSTSMEKGMTITSFCGRLGWRWSQASARQRLKPVHGIYKTMNRRLSLVGRQAIVSRRFDPLFETGSPLLGLGEVAIEALLRAKLLGRISVADKAEAAATCLAARFCLPHRTFGDSRFAHYRDSLNDRAFTARDDLNLHCRPVWFTSITIRSMRVVTAV